MKGKTYDSAMNADKGSVMRKNDCDSGDGCGLKRKLRGRKTKKKVALTRGTMVLEVTA